MKNEKENPRRGQVTLKKNVDILDIVSGKAQNLLNSIDDFVFT